VVTQRPKEKGWRLGREIFLGRSNEKEDWGEVKMREWAWGGMKKLVETEFGLGPPLKLNRLPSHPNKLGKRVRGGHLKRHTKGIISETWRTK